MSYVSTDLLPNERIIIVGRMHWIIYACPAVVFILAIILLFVALSSDHPGTAIPAFLLAIPLLIGSILLFLRSLIDVLMTEFVITNLRIVYKRGFIWRRTQE